MMISGMNKTRLPMVNPGNDRRGKGELGRTALELHPHP